MPKSYFNFAGGKELTGIGASWFVSYMYYLKVDKAHLNWQNISNPMTRASKCANNSRYHKVWIDKIADMNPNRLKRNNLGLTGNDIISMANILLPLM
ncbi:MAG: hypothetical protein IKK46_07420 [Clostridia bacterium]|nr:hypothetical protein [Clostridia bacterium]